ncbi:hypothetical protein [Xinfangfangia pollutisoli]|uniref:hypothetical protein n=1 Tax=Xinfangfangia pollutisoli TaxID=2865960 RepID=UPI001CD7CBF6|nr:hypothetical protein [Xinfangfangia pollutisoli]
MPRALKLLKHLMSDWEGALVGESRLLRILNPAGRKPPLIWCYNSAPEFPAMAQELGPDQPVIGIRSLHLVTPNGPKRFAEDEWAAGLYAEALLASGLALEGCAVGGNCQGGGVAAPLAARLVQSGLRVGMLVLMETQSAAPYPGHVGLLYGAESEMFNPYLRGERLEPTWDRLFESWSVEIVPGAHGTYFTPENRATTCAGIARLLRDGLARPARHTTAGIALELIGLPQSAAAGQPLEVLIRPTAALQGAARAQDLVLHPLWVNAAAGFRVQAEVPRLPASATAEPLRIVVDAPEPAGEWELRLFPCREKFGPVDWTYHNEKRYHLALV